MAFIEIQYLEEDSLSHAVQKTLERFAWRVWLPDETPDEMEAYEHLKRGKCMACGRELGAETVLVVADAGIIAIWCNGQCMSDQLSVGFLQQVEAELVERIENRGTGQFEDEEETPFDDS